MNSTRCKLISEFRFHIRSEDDVTIITATSVLDPAESKMGLDRIVIVQGLIKTIIFSTIARIIGSQLAAKLFTFLVGRMPWWVSWVGPAAWTLSIGWTAFDLQGPATRKTIPVVLYLGLCSLRERHGVSATAV